MNKIENKQLILLTFLLSTDALARSSGSSQSQLFWPTIIVLIFILVMWVWSVFSQSVRLTKAHHEAKNLFLRIAYKFSDSEKTGFIRSLDLKNASLVVNEKMNRGQHVFLQLGSLPNFPKEYNLEAVVTNSKSISGDSESSLIQVKFVPGANQPEETLGNYLEKLI